MRRSRMLAAGLLAAVAVSGCTTAQVDRTGSGATVEPTTAAPSADHTRLLDSLGAAIDGVTADETVSAAGRKVTAAGDATKTALTTTRETLTAAFAWNKENKGSCRSLSSRTGDVTAKAGAARTQAAAVAAAAKELETANAALTTALKPVTAQLDEARTTVAAAPSAGELQRLGVYSTAVNALVAANTAATASVSTARANASEWNASAAKMAESASGLQQQCEDQVAKKQQLIEEAKRRQRENARN